MTRQQFTRVKPGKRTPMHITTVSVTCPDCGETFSYTFTDRGVRSDSPIRHSAPKSDDDLTSPNHIEGE